MAETSCPFCRRKIPEDSMKQIEDSDVIVCENCYKPLSVVYKACLDAAEGEEYDEAFEEFEEKIRGMYSYSTSVMAEEVLTSNLKRQKDIRKIRAMAEAKAKADAKASAGAAADGEASGQTSADAPAAGEEAGASGAAGDLAEKMLALKDSGKSGYYEYKVLSEHDLAGADGDGQGTRIAEALGRLAIDGWQLKGTYNKLTAVETKGFLGIAHYHSVSTAMFVLEKFNNFED
jgi:hypothetical protein